MKSGAVLVSTTSPRERVGSLDVGRRSEFQSERPSSRTDPARAGAAREKQSKSGRAHPFGIRFRGAAPPIEVSLTFLPGCT